MNALLSLAFLVSMSYALNGQQLQGQWKGILNVQGTQLRVVFHVVKTDNQYRATMDSPDQNVRDIPVTAVNFNYPKVTFEISTLGMVYEGTMSDGRITGTWKQSGQSFPLILAKTEDLKE